MMIMHMYADMRAHIRLWACSSLFGLVLCKKVYVYQSSVGIKTFLQ